jgi:hypothetical protein
MKLRASLLMSLLLSSSLLACFARGGGGGHGGGGGRFGGGAARGFAPGENRFGNGGYYGRYPGGYGYGYGGGYYNPLWNDDDSGNYYPANPPYTADDPLADYYRQQAAAQSQATAASMTTPYQSPVNQQQLPTDFGGLQLATVTHSATAATVDRANEVRDNFHVFTQSWWKQYKDAWCNPSWPSNWVWTYTDWDALSRFWGVSAANAPTDYEYGNNVKYVGDVVYYGESPVGDAMAYYKQAQALAEKGLPSATLKTEPASLAVANWRQFGVFSLVRADQTNSTLLFQLAINKAGQIRGNCFNMLTEELSPIFGAVDKSNWRASWTVGKSHNVVYDSGLGNLLSAQSSILVHLDADHTEQYNLVRLRQPSN